MSSGRRRRERAIAVAEGEGHGERGGKPDQGFVHRHRQVRKDRAGGQCPANRVMIPQGWGRI